MFDLFVFTFHNDGHIHRALALRSPAEVQEKGLPTEAVLGEINALLPSMTPDQFEANEKFVALLHRLVGQMGAELSGLQLQAKTQGTGHVSLVDLRVGDEPVLEEDVIGQFAVGRGEIRPDSYQPNPAYRLLTDKGPLQLPPLIEDAILAHVQPLTEAVTVEPS